jgi:hypothetical protein
MQITLAYSLFLTYSYGFLMYTSIFVSADHVIGLLTPGRG